MSVKGVIPEARKMPTLINLGVVSEVGEGVETQSGKYFRVPIQFEAQQAGRDFKHQFIADLEWFEPDFDVSSLTPDWDVPRGEDDENDELRSQNFVYTRNVAKKNGTGFLQKVLGDNFETFYEEVRELASDDELTEETFSQLLGKFIDGEAYIYRLSQGQERNEETGKYEPTEQYELTRIDPATGENVEAAINRARKSQKGKNPQRLTFEVEANEDDE